MTQKRLFIVNDSNRQHVAQQIAALPAGFRIEAKPQARSLDQNAAQWPILEAFSKQLEWPVNGELVYLSAEEWKHVLTAAFKQETKPRLALGVNGGLVMLGARTSQMGKQEFSEWLEFLHSVAAIKGVRLDRAA